MVEKGSRFAIHGDVCWQVSRMSMSNRVTCTSESEQATLVSAREVSERLSDMNERLSDISKMSERATE
jgi:hypothetical protein